MAMLERKMDFTDAERRVIMLPLLLGGFIALLNETILNVAVPSLMGSSRFRRRRCNGCPRATC